MKKPIVPMIHLSPRLTLVFAFVKLFIAISLLLRIILLFWQYSEISHNPILLAGTLITGAFFDVGTISFIILPSLLYISLLPNRFAGSLADRAATYFFFSLTVFILTLTFLSEVTFWDEFHSRFNFIAVDYLIYTHEVLGNIQQSYPLPLLIGGVVAATVAVVYGCIRTSVFRNTFSSAITIRQRLGVLIAALATMVFFVAFVRNSDAEWSNNRYNNEIAKAGIYSFFAEFRNNHMDYAEFYTTISKKEAFGIVRNNLQSTNSHFMSEGSAITRQINSIAPEEKPNVIFILMESMSASFMEEFGNANNITPCMDSLAQNSIFFSNLYATGTRTVRGMEAVTLCIPPTPGQSIVKRPDNDGLYTIGSVFKKKGYDNIFFYGGDGYFDNMNSYFGGNGFTIYDRGRGSVLSDAIKTRQNIIPDSDVTFENAWGICDGDIYEKMLSVADAHHREGKPFFNFIMTTSNHRPYTYPSGKIDIPSGTCRNGAVKYADYALGRMLKKAASKPWFRNTVFVIVADHCASSAGKDEIDVANYHIPAIIYNLQEAGNQKVSKLCSQIDLFPTLFALLNWDYSSNFFGNDIMNRGFEERALSGTYRKLALMKGNDVMVLSDQKKQNFYKYNYKTNVLLPKKTNDRFLHEAISWYESADYLFNNQLLKDKL